ncbi:MAG: tetratricopeptide repeat protein [Ktedonobacteraceae bacterium]
MQYQDTSSAFNINLPVPLTPIIGREDEIGRTCLFLRHSHGRLLTLTGPGGVGKTRLALHIATNLLHDFADGIYFVPLAPIRDPQFVIPTIAKALGVQESADQPLLEHLTTALTEKHLLLLLDNFEQIVSAAPVLTTLLETCPSVYMLVTSREVLRVRGEQEFIVPPLALPDLKLAPTTEALSEVAAVALFVQRTRSVKPNFQFTSANAQVIAEICTRLDGLPLALELAAARLKLLSLPALLARLEHRLQVLTRGTREVDERQQTLLNTLQWSYELLPAQEQRIFRCLAAFSGSWTLSAAQVICQTTGEVAQNMEDGLSSLVDKSLVQLHIQDNDEVRFSLLETIREYALHCLEENGEQERIQAAHATYYLALAEQILPELDGPRQTECLAQLEREYDNLRAALKWALEQAEFDQTSSEMALRLCYALRIFWVVRCYWSEGLSFLERTLAVSQDTSSVARAGALWAAAGLTTQLDDYDRAEAFGRESLALYRKFGDTPGIARALYTLGATIANRSDYPAARVLTEEALALARKGSDRVRLARILVNLGEIVNVQGEYDTAQALFAESLNIQRELENKEGIAWSLFKSAWGLIVSQGKPEKARTLLAESLAIAREMNDKDKIADCLIYSGHVALGHLNPSLARTLLEESLVLAREIGDLWAIAESLCALAKVACVEGDYPTARQLCEESLHNARKVNNKELVASGLERLACIVVNQGEAIWAAQLWGAAERLRETTGACVTPLEGSSYEPMIIKARTQLGKQTFAANWTQGRTMSPEQALAPMDSPTLPQPTMQQIVPLPVFLPSPYPVELTPREIEVMRLVAQGLTNGQIAEQLTISSHTVNSHVRSILSKLGVTSRSAIIHFAFEHHLL